LRCGVELLTRNLLERCDDVVAIACSADVIPAGVRIPAARYQGDVALAFIDARSGKGYLGPSDIDLKNIDSTADALASGIPAKPLAVVATHQVEATVTKVN
jgi:hypothetical protein